MELAHTCGPARSLDKNAMPSIEGTMYFHPEKKVWYGGDDEGETQVIIKFCPFCGLDLSTLSAPSSLSSKAGSGTLEQN